MTYDKHDCDQMCERLAAYIEGDLTPDEQARAEQHLSECETCAEALVELRAIAGEAAQLPLLSPSRDLWAGIEARISTPVTHLGEAPTKVPIGEERLTIAARRQPAPGRHCPRARSREPRGRPTGSEPAREPVGRCRRCRAR